MELRIINTKHRLPHSKPFISFGRTGIVLLNKAAAKAMNLQLGDHIEFGQDPTNDEDWFVRKCKKSDFKLRANTDATLVCSGQTMCRNIKKSTGYPENRTIQYAIQEQSTDGWHLLLTSRAKIIEK
jgi:hypothetical protein